MASLLRNSIKRSLLLNNYRQVQTKNVTTTQSGAVLPEPEKVPFGLIGIVFTVIPGLLVGATISKYMANFLEENELFVPSDDDDDDD